MKTSELFRILRNDGWEVVAQKGSHKQLKHPTKTAKLIVPDHGAKEIATGTLHAILRQAGLK
jgi:predicted RNA binding protein YcfA (HicA-like mRNA interferase family)